MLLVGAIELGSETVADASEGREVVAEAGGIGRHARAHDGDVDFNHAEQTQISFLLQNKSKIIDLHKHEGIARIPCVVLFIILANTVDEGYNACCQCAELYVSTRKHDT